MGGKDVCCVINCRSSRDKIKKEGGSLIFFSFPMGKSTKATKRRNLWVEAIRRKHFVPTHNTRVCELHFVSGLSINDPNSVDFVPTLKLGYEKRKKEPRRSTRNSKKTQNLSDDELASFLDHNMKRQICGLSVPELGAEVTLGHVSEPADVPSRQVENDQMDTDHSYCKRWCDIEVKRTSLQKAIGCQTEADLHQEILRLKEVLAKKEQELKEQESQMEQYKEALRNVQFNPDSVLTTDKAVQFYTGLRSRQIFDELLRYIKPKAEKMHLWQGEKKNYSIAKGTQGRQRSCPIDVQFLGVLVRLRVGLFIPDISGRMGVSQSMFSRLFASWIRLLRLTLQEFCRFPSRQEVRHFMPPASQKYTNLRCIIDCTEFFVETPASLTAQRETWSQYKSHNTVKVLVGCTPDGVLCFISKLYGGAASDNFITTDCGFIDELEVGDQVMADKGFNIQADLKKKGVFLNLPPFRNPGTIQFEEHEVEQTKRIAEVRIHVERLILRIKNFHILDGTLPLTLQPIAEDIIHTCAYLTMFQSPIIAQDPLTAAVGGNSVSGGS